MRHYILLLTLLFATTLFAQNSLKPIIIAVGGGTGSGKSTLAAKLATHFHEDSITIDEDSYYKDLSHLSKEERAAVNFDHPDSLDFALLKADLLALKEGKKIQKPNYDFVTHTRKKESEEVKPQKIIIVEGILLLAMTDLLPLFDYKVYVDHDADIRLMRRIERDINERGRSLESVMTQYTTTVKPMHERFVEPSKWKADVIIPSVGHNQIGIDMLIHTLQARLASAAPASATPAA